jgi:hypothetical protein
MGTQFQPGPLLLDSAGRGMAGATIEALAVEDEMADEKFRAW